MWGYNHQRGETKTSEDCSKIIVLEVGGLIVFQLHNIYTIELDLPFSQTSRSDLFSMIAINIYNCLTVFVQQYSVLRVHESKIVTRLRKSIPSYFMWYSPVHRSPSMSYIRRCEMVSLPLNGEI